MSWAVTAVWGSSSPLFKYSIYSKFPKNILPDFFSCLIFKMRAHCKKYVIHMFLTHFYPVHQNAVFILNVKMPFMSLYMSPFKLLFLNDIGTCFASFKIYWGICNVFPNTGFWDSSFCLLQGNSCFLGSILMHFLNLRLHFNCLSESHYHREEKTQIWLAVSFRGIPGSSVISSLILPWIYKVMGGL